MRALRHSTSSSCAWQRERAASEHRRMLVRRCLPPEEPQLRISKQTEKQEQERPTDDSTAVFGSLSAVAKLQGRSSKTNGSTAILASDASDDTWRKLDKRVNKYPGTRTFTAIGLGGSEFKSSMISAVESVVGSVHCECISERTSSQQRYISVTVGPVWVEDSEQVLEIYARMRADERLKYFI